MQPLYRTLCLALSGATAASLHAQVLSQRQLNGFLIGQHRDAIAASFSTVLRVDTTSDGWLYRSYLLDTTHHAYMSFKFSSDKPEGARSSVQRGREPSCLGTRRYRMGLEIPGSRTYRRTGVQGTRRPVASLGGTVPLNTCDPLGSAGLVTRDRPLRYHIHSMITYRPLVALLAGVAAVASCTATAPNEAETVHGPALLVFYGDTTTVIMPASVQVGEPASVKVTAFGGGCIGDGETDVTVSGLEAEVQPYRNERVRLPPNTGCTMELRLYTHTAVLTFAHPGEAQVRVVGLARPGDTPYTVVRSLTVLP